MSNLLEITPKRIAVIDAAKARDSFGVSLSCLEHTDNCCREWCDACKYGYAADSTLVSALEALQEAEGEEAQAIFDVIEAAEALEASLDHPEKDYQGVLKVALAVRALRKAAK